MPPAEMRTLLGDARKLAMMKTEHDQAAADQAGRLKLMAIFCLIVGGVTIFTGIAQEKMGVVIDGALFLVCGALMKMRLGVKVVAIALMLMSVLQIWGRLLNFGPLVLAAGPAALAAAPMWLASVALFVGIIVMAFKMVLHDPKKNTLPPPLPVPAPPATPAIAASAALEQSGDKS